MANKISKKKSQQKIQDALNILIVLGLPRQQLNERSALTLLSLLALEPGTEWAGASDPLMGITPRKEICAEYSRNCPPPDSSSIFASGADCR